MKKFILPLSALLLSLGTAQAQSDEKIRFSRQELSINAFRNPSIGLEYRLNRVSAHVGYYPTILSDDVKTESGADNNTTSFVRAGLTYWFLPIYSTRKNPSSFYASASYVRGLDYDYENRNGMMGEVGFRWVVWQGLNVRIGAAALKAPGRDWQINPTPGISYSFFIR